MSSSLDEFAKLRIPLDDIVLATNNFANENLVKEDGIVKIYKGKLSLQSDEWIDVDVWRLVGMDDLKRSELSKEIQVLSNLKHENLISIIGFCDENDDCIIVIEQAVYGSLDQHLHDPTLITWSQRLKICLGFVQGFWYLHQNHATHDDIGCSRVLLNKDWEAKVSCFGLSPENDLLLTFHSDPIYDLRKDGRNISPFFGMILLEVLCGRKPNLADDKRHFIKKTFHETIDPTLRAQMHSQSLLIFLKIVYDCLDAQQDVFMHQIKCNLENALELQLKHEYIEKNMGHLKIPLSDIVSATNNFSERYLIQSDDYVKLYKAELNQFDRKSSSTTEASVGSKVSQSRGFSAILNLFARIAKGSEGSGKGELPRININVAIKHLTYDKNGKRAKDLFEDFETLIGCKHENIASPLGFSWEGSRMILVYEYPCKGHLCDYLRSTNEDLFEDSETLIGCKHERTSPTWEQRIRISLDIARGMDYFFNNMEMVKKSNILEKGVMSENILLGDEWNAKIASFRFLENSVGMDRYRVSREIYSLGVLLMEILSGRLILDTYLFNQIGEELDSNLLKKLVDPKILEEVHDLGYTKKIGPNQDSLDAFSEITYRCMAKIEAEEKEPTLAFAIQELEKALHFQVQGGNLEHLKIPLEDVVSATQNFAERYRIGSGGYADVYKAKLKIFCRKGSLPQERKNSTVAIKRILRREDEQGNEGFLAEVEVLSRCEHPNIVSLLGFCVEGLEKILIYEHAENGSLNSYLGCNEPKIYLTWSQRIKLCLDVAYGLNYLHTAMMVKNRIIHRDIKSDNILLDENWQAKIADFGLSKIQPMNQDASTIVTNNIAGTYVYWDPEYKRTGRLKKESDIYSLGVVFFENLCGKLAYHSSYMAQNDNGLAPIARRHFDEGTLKEMIDPKIMEEAHELNFTRKVGPNQQSLDVFSNIAYQCVAKTQAKRPTMESVIKELKKALDFQENYIPKISLTDVNSATENFSDKNFIRTGGYGKVYNGSVVYNTGTKPVLVKRLHKTSQEHNFLTELEIISMHKHENVIGLVGYCKEMDEKIIVYEHMSKGSLDMHLNKVSLGWKQRLKICIDVARGLEFLHGSIQKEDVVIHRDIKSSSILLNGDWKAKISDFEQSLITPADRKRPDYVMNDVVGTPGYCEYPLNRDMGFLSEESDIYSFGVVLFEIYCGRLTMENFNATGQYLDSFVIDCFRILDEIVFKDIKEHIAPQSLTTFQMIAYQCLHRKRQKRPTIGEVVVQLIKALQYQDDHEIWELKLPIDYKDIFQLSTSPDIYSTKSKKDLYDMLSEGIVLQDGKVWFSFGSTGERTELVSARTFSYINHCPRRWRSIKESRFEKVVEMLDIKNLMIKIKKKAHFLSPGTVYGVYLVFKFCDSRKISSKPTYVNLQYRKGGKSETLNAFFSTRRDEEWMMIELFRFLNHNDNTVFEFLLQSISPYYCGHDTIYVEGVEFRVIENASLDISTNSTQVTDEETEKLEEVSPELKLNSNASKFQRSKNNDELFWLNEVNGKKHLVLSAKKVLYDLSNEKLFTSKSSAESSLLSEPIFEEVIELRPQQVFRIKCKFESQKLSPDTNYSCYLVFRLSDKCCGLYCPVKVRNLLQRRNKESEIIYFRSPSPWNLHDNNHVPKQRKDGWMEVKVWKLNSSHQLKMDHINVNLTFISYEGTMAGLIVCALEFRPM